MSANKIPGCVVTSKLVAELAEEAKTQDKGKSIRLLERPNSTQSPKGWAMPEPISEARDPSDMVEFIITKG